MLLFYRDSFLLCKCNCNCNWNGNEQCELCGNGSMKHRLLHQVTPAHTDFIYSTYLVPGSSGARRPDCLGKNDDKDDDDDDDSYPTPRCRRRTLSTLLQYWYWYHPLAFLSRVTCERLSGPKICVCPYVPVSIHTIPVRYLYKSCTGTVQLVPALLQYLYE